MKKYIAILASALLVFSACEKSFEVDQTSVLTGSNAAAMVESDPEFLASYVNGFFAYMVQFSTGGRGDHDDFGYLSLGMITDLMCQDIAVRGSWNWGTYDINCDYGAYNYQRPYQFWNFCYTLIGKANEVIDFFGEEDPTNTTLQGYLGQAYAIRIMAYTSLINIFQDCFTGTWEAKDMKFDASKPAVPIVFATRDGKTAEEVDALSGRNTLADIQEHIEYNIEKALPLLKNYTRSSKNEISYEVAQGLAARYYLFTQQWDKAKEAAKAAQNGFDLMDKTRLMSGFKELNDNEVMWGFNHTTETQTTYASFFSHMSNENSGYGGIGQSIRCIDASLYAKIPSSDYRKALFNSAAGDPKAATVGAQEPYASRKFGYDANWLQDYTFMRAAEMYLIEAEAEVMLGEDAKAAYGALVSKRDPAYIPATVKLEDVVLQRRIELWGEGFNFFDLRRLCLTVDRTYEGTNHLAAAQYIFKAHQNCFNFQIPRQEMQNNTHITELEQNEWETGAQ